MFIGAINSGVRSMLAEIARDWPDDVYIGCSGNFTVERILASMGTRKLHSNDVSLYSCSIGHWRAGTAFPVKLKPGYEWMGHASWPLSWAELVATIMMAGEYVQFEKGETPYHERMKNACVMEWNWRMATTVERAAKAMMPVKLESFFAGDVMEWLATVPSHAAVASFPPTYKAGYEKIYAGLDEVFDWPKPQYETFDEKRFGAFLELATNRKNWMVARDHEIPALASHLRGVIQTGARSKPVYVYASGGPARVEMPNQRTEVVPIPRPHPAIAITSVDRLALAPLTQAQMNTLRSEYLSKEIAPAPGLMNLAVTAGGYLVGALAFSRPKFGRGAYMLSDFAIRPTRYKRLSKLIAGAALSIEVRSLLEMKLATRVETIATTAFTDKKASMKYRGLFTSTSRKDGRLNYQGIAGQWTLQDALVWWLKNHANS